jgi:beta-glucanase (GH16 family)
LPANSTFGSQNPTAGIQPNFWLFPNDPTGVYSEIDIFEMNTESHDNQYGYLNSVTLHYPKQPITQNSIYPGLGWGDKIDPNGSSDILNRRFQAPMNFYQNFNDGLFHKVGLEWQNEYISIYKDDVLMTSMNFHQGDMDAVNVILSCVAGSGFFGPPTPYTQFPFKFEIDYFRYYELQKVNNLNTKSICSTLDYFNLNNIVDYKISIGGSGCTAKVPAGANKNIRALIEVELTEGFEVDDKTNVYINAQTF